MVNESESFGVKGAYHLIKINKINRGEELDILRLSLALALSTMQLGHVTQLFPCVWYTEKTSEREALQTGRRTQGICEGQGLVMVTGVVGIRSPSVR
ncbi:hypothetical protein TNCV_1489941 [Trichonephila clavipes]|nr:hypothetical protein TNCV_1489941 [Trichonephila clavipes]